MSASLKKESVDEWLTQKTAIEPQIDAGQRR